MLVEASCRGRPAVASRVGGIVDLVRDGENGLLVPSEDPRALADALVGVLSDAALAERNAALAEREGLEQDLRAARQEMEETLRQERQALSEVTARRDELASRVPALEG